MNELKRRKDEGISITKKEFMSSNNYVRVEKGLIDFEQLKRTCC